jgi:hypothetical protein
VIDQRQTSLPNLGILIPSDPLGGLGEQPTRLEIEPILAFF